ncbi:MAG: rhomboid family intramembrane serine protease [Microbacteriaceae bacterium]
MSAKRSGRLPAALRWIWRFLWSTPVSVVLAVVIVVTAILVGTFFNVESSQTEAAWGTGVIPIFSLGHWWSPLTALFIPSDPLQVVVGVVCALLFLGIAERLMGSVRTIAAFVVSGVVGILIGVSLQALGNVVQEWWATGTTLDITLDPLTGIAGALVAASAFASGLWRRRIRVITFAVLLMFVLYDGDSYNVYRLIAAIAGLGLGVLLRRSGTPHKWMRSSHSETRTLLAAILAVSAIGPMVALFSASQNGVFYYLGDLFRASIPDGAEILQKCAAEASEACDQQLAQLNLFGVGPLLLTFMPLILLLVAALGLRRGRRFALWLAIGLKLLLAVLGFFAFGSLTDVERLRGDFWEYVVWGAAGFVVPLGIAVLLWVNRRFFQVKAPRRALGEFLVSVVLAFVVLAVADVVIALSNRQSFIPSGTDPAALIADIPRRFLPSIFLGNVGQAFYPTDDATLFVFQWIGPTFWAVFILASIRLIHSTSVAIAEGDEARIRSLLKAGGGGTLGFMATWPGNVYWFTSDGTAAVAYRVINGVAITLSDPVCAKDKAEETIRGFAQWCDENSWMPVFYSVHAEYLPVFDEMGWQYMSVGEETLMHPIGFDLVGKPWQKVRQALNRGIKEGLTTQWTTWDELPLSMVNRINAISEQWVAEKELPEMGFTLGAMEELKDPDVKLMLALDQAGEMQAITSWLPSYRDGAVVGWTIDFMRRADGSMNGVMEFLIASAALHMKDDGIEVLSLSGAPLATAPTAPGEAPAQATVMSRLLDFLARTLEPAYGFSSLFRFKAKFNPSYSTIYMAYPDPLALPTIGTAIGKAYLPDASPREYLALVRTLVK